MGVAAGSGYTVGSPSSASVTINDNDAAVPVVTIAAGTSPVTEGTAATFTLTASPAPAAALAVDLTASGAAGFVSGALPTTATIGTGGTVTVTIATEDDATDEADAALTVGVAAGSGYTVGSPSRASVTINDNDAAVPAVLTPAWLGRFGRTVAEQVLDGVQARFTASRTPGLQGTLAGQQLNWTPRQADADTNANTNTNSDTDASVVRHTPARLAMHEQPSRGPQNLGQIVTWRELLTGSAFTLTTGSAEGGFASLWGRGAHSAFTGREVGRPLDGRVTTGELGADWQAGRLVAGLTLAHSAGTGAYQDPATRVAVTAMLTGVYPYVGYDLTERLALWGLGGYGQGRLTRTPENQAGRETDLTLGLGAAGIRGALLTPETAQGVSLDVVADVTLTRTTSRGTTQVRAAAADTSRIRVALEGARSLAVPGGTVTPRLEVGVRHDDGDAETGTGLDLGGGLTLAGQEGLTVALHARTLVTHEAAGFQLWGVAGSFSYDPDPASDRGLTLALTSRYGGAATGGAQALFNQPTLDNRAAPTAGQAGQMEATLAYGLPAWGNRLIGTPWVGFGLTETGRTWRVGWRLTPVGASAFTLNLEAARQKGAHTPAPTHSLRLRLEVQF